MIKNYLADFSKEFKARLSDYKIIILILLPAFIIGELICGIIVNVANSDDYLSIGMLLCMVVGGMFLCLYIATQTIIDFEMAIKMGRTRRQTILGLIINTLFVSVSSAAALKILDLLDKLINKVLYGDLPYVFEMYPGFLKLLTILVILNSICFLLGTLIQKYGKPVLIAAYFLWMLLCFTTGPILHIVMEKSTSSLLGRIIVPIAEFFVKISNAFPYAGIVILCLTVIAVFTVSAQLLKKASVNN